VNSGLDFWLVLAAGALIGGCLMAIWGQAWRHEAGWQQRRADRLLRESAKARQADDELQNLRLWAGRLWHTSWSDTWRDIEQLPEVER
jgi:hypothetical protein